MSQQINLVNPLLLKRRNALGLREMALGMGLVLAGMLVWGGYLHYHAGTLEALALQQDTRLVDAQRELDRLTALAARPASTLLAERVEAARVEVAQREALLASVSGTIEATSSGFASRLRALGDSSTEGVWLNGFTLSPAYVSLKGSAVNAGLLTRYMAQLGNQAPFVGMKFSGLNAVLTKTSDAEQAPAAALPRQVDFVLYAGSPDKSAGTTP